MFLPAVLCATLVSSAISGSPENSYMDEVLKQDILTNQSGGWENVRLKGFSIEIEANSNTSKTFKANFSTIAVGGLNRLHRTGECSLNPHEDGILILCDVQLYPLSIDMSARLENGRSISVHGEVRNGSSFRVGLFGFPGDVAERVGLSMELFELNTEDIRRQLQLDSESSVKLNELLEAELGTQLNDKLLEDYRYDLLSAAEDIRMPGSRRIAV